MAKSCALFVVGLVLASLCVADAGRIPADIVADATAAVGGLAARIVDLVIVFDLTQVPENVETGKATLIKGNGVVNLEAGKVDETTAANVKLHGGVVRVLLEILGVEKEIMLDLAKLKAILVAGELKVVVVLVLTRRRRCYTFGTKTESALAVVLKL